MTTHNAQLVTVALVACAGSKLDHAAPARDLYVSDLFRKAAALAEATADDWFVLSAKHYLVAPEKVLEPYDVELGHKRAGPPIHLWANTTAELLVVELQAAGYRLDAVKLLVLAGRKYWEPLTQYLPAELVANAELPLEGLGIGQQKSWLKAQLADVPAGARPLEARVVAPVVEAPPAPAPVVDRASSALAELLVEERRLEARKVELVLEARAAGASWSLIGARLGVSKQAAAKRFGPLEEEATRAAIRADMASLRGA